VKRYNSLWDAPDKNRFFENPPMVSFQKTDFGVSSAKALETPKSVS